MRFIHTADWHLGRVFHNVSLLEDQRHILGQLLSEIERRRPDALIIAGDVYDKAIPSEGAIRLLEDFIQQVGGPLNVPIIMISGNHDSGARLSFASGLLAKASVHIIGKSDLEIRPIVLQDEYGEIYFYPLPYLSPLAARSLYQDEAIKTHQDVIQHQVDDIRTTHPAGKRKVLIMHQFVTGAEESESERQLSVGGSSHIDAKLVADFDYVAMGHLHRPQATGHEHIRYSGSLLKYSFSEVTHHKGVTEVVLNQDGFSESMTVPLLPLHDMRIIRGKLEEIILQGKMDTRSDDYICAELLDDDALYEPMRRLQEVYPNALEIRYVAKTNPKGIGGKSNFQELQKQNICELFAEFYQHVCAEPLNSNQQQFITTLVEQLAHEND